MPDQFSPEEALASARRTLQTEIQGLQDLSARLDGSFGAAVRLLLDCRGRVVISGLGKTGHIARKIAATLASTGTPAFFVHAAEAVHGDLGMITAEDVLIALSYSGTGMELLTIVPVARRMGARAKCGRISAKWPACVTMGWALSDALCPEPPGCTWTSATTVRPRARQIDQSLPKCLPSKRMMPVSRLCGSRSS